MRALPIALALCVAGCSGDETTDKPTDTATETDTTETTEDSGTRPPPDLTGQLGAITFADFGESALGPSGRIALGHFANVDGGYLNPIACLVLGTTCIEAYPKVGKSVSPTQDTNWLNGATFVNLGSDFEANDVFLLDASAQFGAQIYLGTPLGLQGSGNVTLAGDLMPYMGTGVIDNADDMTVVSPDPMQTLRVGPKDTVDFTWKKATNGDPYLEINGTVFGLDDSTGTFALDIDSLGLTPPADVAVATLSRIRHTTIDASGNNLEVQSRSDQSFLVEYVELLKGWSELTDKVDIAGTCKDAQALTALPEGKYVGTLTGYANDINLAYGNDLTGFDTAGLDAVVKIDLSAGEILTMNYNQPGADAAMFLLADDCDPANGLVGQDAPVNNGVGLEESMNFTATKGGSYFLVLDNWMPEDSGGLFTLTLTIL
ncbi:MAG: hypothetical protein KTR31_06535 [Myxococcales bacterium]|nr:hypothetical protein [Myxococcales bacterium]